MSELDEKALTAAWMRFVRLSCGYEVGRDTLAEAIRAYLTASPSPTVSGDWVREVFKPLPAAEAEALRDLVPANPDGEEAAATIERLTRDNAGWLKTNSKLFNQLADAEAALAKAQQERDAARELFETQQGVLKLVEKNEHRISAELAKAREDLRGREIGWNGVVDAIIQCERGALVEDVLANYRQVRRSIQDSRAALSPAPDSEGKP